MIAFAACVGTQATFDRYARPGLAACAEPGSPVAEIETDSIFAGYNEALEHFATLPFLEALVLMHEDVQLRDLAFCSKIRALFASDPSIAIAGVIGARGVRSLCWWEGEMRGRVRETRGLIDRGAGRHDVDVLDGLLLVLSPWAVRELRFDSERFHGFHGYDADICLQARAAGRRVVTEDLDVVHHTRGGIGDGEDFWRADGLFRAKWSALGMPMASDAELTAHTREFAVAERQ